MKVRWFSVFVLLPGVLAAAAPVGLSPSDWQSIRTEYTHHRQAVVAADGGWRARNVQQDWSAFFDGRGFEVTPGKASWRWGLKLTSYGYRGQERPVGTPESAADGEKFTYQWDSLLREWYINANGLEHGYTLAARPGKGTGLRFRLEILGTLQAQIAANARSVAFVERQGLLPAVTYGGLKVTDATGRELGARFHLEAHELLLEVDDNDARYPVTIDPVAQQVLTVGHLYNDNGLGTAVAIEGDRIVVGAPFEASPTDSGAAYIFHRPAPGGQWTLEATLRASNADAGDYFGWSVAISGDTVVVGAWGEAGANNSLPNSGAAYIFQGAAGWAQVAYLKASNAAANDYFGFSVAVSGGNVVVGAFRKDIQKIGIETEAGAVYLFEAPGWGQTAFLTAPTGPQVSARFGWSVAASGNTVAASAYQEFFSSGNGRVHLFTRGAFGGWNYEGALQAPNPDPNDGFGLSLAMSGDTIVVGAPGEGSSGIPSDNSIIDAGAVYVWFLASQGWTLQAYLKAWPPKESAGFGASVALSGDTILVGRYTYDAMEVFVRTGGDWKRRATLNSSDFDPRAPLGHLAVSGDTVVTGPDVHVFQLPAPQTVSISINTSPQGRSFTTSGIGCAAGSYFAPQTLVWTTGSECMVTASPGGLSFTHWEDNSTIAARKITAPYSAQTFAASFGARYTISVVPAGAGSVSGPNFNCQSSCILNMDAEPQGPITFTASPLGQFTFSGWAGDCSGTGACAFPSIGGDRVLTANFTPLPTTLTAALGIRSGPASARQFPITFTNTGPGMAADISILTFSVGPQNPTVLVPANCASVTRPDLPAGFNLTGATSQTFYATIDISKCGTNPLTGRYNFSMLYFYNGHSHSLNMLGLFP